jgi:hypothetical protein
LKHEQIAMSLLNRLGLRRPAPPKCAVKSQFRVAGVTIINPMYDRTAGATIEIADGAITSISRTEGRFGFLGRGGRPSAYAGYSPCPA